MHSEHMYSVAEMAMVGPSIWTWQFVQMTLRVVEWSIFQFPNRAGQTAFITDWQFRCHGIGPPARTVGL